MQYLADNIPFTKQQLIDEFGANKRTIERDLELLQKWLPMDKNRETGAYRLLEGHSLGQNVFGDEELLILYLSLHTVEDITPKFKNITDKLFSKLMRGNYMSPYFIKQDPFESIDIDSRLMNQLEEAIAERKLVRLELANGHEVEVEPYKIVSFDEIWYLFAKDIHLQKVRTYMISKIDYCQINPYSEFCIDRPIDEILENVQTAWFEDGTSFDVTIRVEEPIAHYFKIKKHLQSQEILEERPDGSLLISFEVSSDEDVDNLIKAWLPHIEVLEPQRFRERLVTELQEYLQRFA